MADQRKPTVSSPSNLNNYLCCNESEECQLCLGLKSELTRARQEILSYEKVIQILREELINMAQRAQPVGSATSEFPAQHGNNHRPKEGWQKVPLTSWKRKPTKKLLEQTISHTYNKFEYLTNLKEDKDPPSRTNQVAPRLKQKQNSSVAKHKVLILGDSHARGSAMRLQSSLGKEYAISSFVKPGAQMKAITTTANDEKKMLKHEDVLVLWGGSNNISKNNTREAVSNVLDQVNESKEVNIVLISAPHRHDLSPDSCVNKEVCKYNRCMKKLAKLYTKVKFFELDVDRSHFTRHGMHLNSQGKDSINFQLAKYIELLLTKTQFPPIPIPWKFPTTDSTAPINDDVTTDPNSTHQRRKCPRPKHPDFLWT